LLWDHQQIYRNPSLGLATKARACKVAGQEGSLGIAFHAPESAKECEGMNRHTPKWSPILGVEVLMDFQIFKKNLQRSKPIRLKNYLYHQKVIEMWMSKMGLHNSFGYMKHKLWLKERSGIKLTIDSQTLKVKNRPNFLAWRWRAKYYWKDLDKGYNFALDLTSIRGLHTKLWVPKVARIRAVGIPGFSLGSPRTKCHLDVGLVERHRI
jgi:hypothetical protein